MNTWHLLSNRWNSAITEYALSTCRALMERGIATTLICLDEKPAFKRSTNYKINTIGVKNFGFSSYGSLRQLYKTKPCTHIFTYGGEETLLASFLKTEFQTRQSPLKLARFRGEAIRSKNIIHEFKLNLGLKCCDTVIAPCTLVADELNRFLRKGNVQRILLGCDVNKFFWDPATYTKESRPTMTILGRLDPIKGHFGFLKVFADLLKVWPVNEVRPLLKIIGEPANISDSALRNHASLLGLNEPNDLEFIFERLPDEDLRQALTQSSLGVIPSLGSELIGRVSQEFLLCGTRIFISGVGGLEDVLFTGAGLSYRGLTEGAMTHVLKMELLASWLENPEDKALRAKKAKEIFSFNAMGNELEKVL